MSVEERYKKLTIREKMEILIQDMINQEITFKEAVNEFKKIYIQIASQKYKGNKTRMSKALGIHRNTLHNLTKNFKN